MHSLHQLWPPGGCERGSSLETPGSKTGLLGARNTAELNKELTSWVQTLSPTTMKSGPVAFLIGLASDPRPHAPWILETLDPRLPSSHFPCLASEDQQLHSDPGLSPPEDAGNHTGGRPP